LKEAAILVAPVIDLHQIPEQDRASVRRFLFDHIKGLDATNDARWKRFWGRIWNAEAGEVFHLEHLIGRSGPFHRMHMAMEQRLFESQDRFNTLEKLRLWLKAGAAWGTYQYSEKAGRMVFVPASTSYDKCSDDEMREVHRDMVAYLRTDYAQKRLWRHLKRQAREEMVETILAGRVEE